MSINFEAANMVGYNNPDVCILRAAFDATGSEVLSAPSFATINNLVKSGFMPVVYVTVAGGDSVVMPLATTSAAGDYLFSCVYITGGTSTPIVATLLFSQNSDNPAFLYKRLKVEST